MAYSTDNPPALASQRVGASGGAVWIYKDGDALATVNGINYVSDAADLGMKAGDRVIHIDETNGVTSDMAVVAGATIGTASGALCSAIEPVGETSVALQSAGTGTFLIGDIVNFGNGDTTEYRITTGDADISGGGTLVITPALVVATAVGTTISIKSDVLNMSEGVVGSKLISGEGATKTLTKAEAGANILFDRAAGIVYTLPAPVVGLKFKFVVSVSVTSNAYTVNTDAATTFIVGNIQQIIAANAVTEGQVANGTTHTGIASNGTTTGGLLGSEFELECISSTLWVIKGNLVSSGTLVTPFTT